MLPFHAARTLLHDQPIAQTALLTAGLSAFPTTRGQHIIILKSDNLFNVADEQFAEVMTFVQRYADMVRHVSGVQRCGLAYDGFQNIHIIPMHGLSEQWTPILAQPTPKTSCYPGFLWTKSSPQSSDEELTEVQNRLTAISGWHTPNNTFLGDAENSNLFAKLVRGEIPQWRIWEDDSHVAFLTPFANTPAFTVVVPRRHLSSDIFSLPSEHFLSLSNAIRTVTATLMSGMATSRMGLFFEGYEIDYAHAKLVPILDDSIGIEGPSTEYHETYPGHITTRLGPQPDSSLLDEQYRSLLDYLQQRPFTFGV